MYRQLFFQTKKNTIIKYFFPNRTQYNIHDARNNSWNFLPFKPATFPLDTYTYHMMHPEKHEISRGARRLANRSIAMRPWQWPPGHPKTTTTFRYPPFIPCRLRWGRFHLLFISHCVSGRTGRGIAIFYAISATFFLYTNGRTLRDQVVRRNQYCMGSECT